MDEVFYLMQKKVYVEKLKFNPVFYNSMIFD
jgi:hypothetical protein